MSTGCSRPGRQHRREHERELHGSAGHGDALTAPTTPASIGVGRGGARVGLGGSGIGLLSRLLPLEPVKSEATSATATMARMITAVTVVGWSMGAGSPRVANKDQPDHDGARRADQVDGRQVGRDHHLASSEGYL